MPTKSPFPEQQNALSARILTPKTGLATQFPNPPLNGIASVWDVVELDVHSHQESLKSTEWFAIQKGAGVTACPAVGSGG